MVKARRKWMVKVEIPSVGDILYGCGCTGTGPGRAGWGTLTPGRKRVGIGSHTDNALWMFLQVRVLSGVQKKREK